MKGSADLRVVHLPTSHLARLGVQYSCISWQKLSARQSNLLEMHMDEPSHFGKSF